MHIKNRRSPNTVVISITHSVFVSHVAFNLVALNLSNKCKQTVDDRVTKYTNSHSFHRESICAGHNFILSENKINASKLNLFCEEFIVLCIRLLSYFCRIKNAFIDFCFSRC